MNVFWCSENDFFHNNGGMEKKLRAGKELRWFAKSFFEATKKVDSFEKQKRTKTQMCFDLRFVFL